MRSVLNCSDRAEMTLMDAYFADNPNWTRRRLGVGGARRHSHRVITEQGSENGCSEKHSVANLALRAAVYIVLWCTYTHTLTHYLLLDKRDGED